MSTPTAVRTALGLAYCACLVLPYFFSRSAALAPVLRLHHLLRGTSLAESTPTNLPALLCLLAIAASTVVCYPFHNVLQLATAKHLGTYPTLCVSIAGQALGHVGVCTLVNWLTAPHDRIIRWAAARPRVTELLRTASQYPFITTLTVAMTSDTLGLPQYAANILCPLLGVSLLPDSAAGYVVGLAPPLLATLQVVSDRVAAPGSLFPWCVLAARTLALGIVACALLQAWAVGLTRPDDMHAAGEGENEGEEEEEGAAPSTPDAEPVTFKVVHHISPAPSPYWLRSARKTPQPGEEGDAAGEDDEDVQRAASETPSAMRRSARLARRTEARSVAGNLTRSLLKELNGTPEVEEEDSEESDDPSF